MAQSKPSYLIVGAGVFGVSTAYHLITKYPDASVTIVDRDAFDADNRVAASWDWNKVMRADYDDLTYCELALEAQDVFKSDALWKPHFHETGIYWMCGKTYAQACIDNFERLGRGGDISAWPVEEARKLYGGLFANADYTDVEQVLVNRGSGWVAAGDCLLAVTREAIRRGVKYVTADVACLEFDRHGNCAGVVDKTGRVTRADHVVLCTGAFTPKLLEISAARSGNDSLQAGPRILAGGITTGMTTLDDDTYARFASMPVGVQGYTARAAIEPFVGSLPPTKDRELKWWGQQIFKNTSEILPGRYISMPPSEPDYNQWKISDKLKDDIQAASRIFYGSEVSGWKFEKHRICWDAFTTSSDFIISPHPASKGLYVATCGSFHGYKFFPVLGKYIIQMMEGDLSSELQQKWAWDRQRPDPAMNPDWPRVEMKDLYDHARVMKL